MSERDRDACDENGACSKAVYFLVTSMVLTPFLVGQFGVVTPWLYTGSFGAWLLVSTLNLSLVATILLCYYWACTTDPGSPPREWKPANARTLSNTRLSPPSSPAPLSSPTLAALPGSGSASTLLSSSAETSAAAGSGALGAEDDARYCNKCLCYKPPRSHHCRKCGRCILRMDHHCPWIGQCVGYRNHGFFLFFLVSAVTALTYATFLALLRLVLIIREAAADMVVLENNVGMLQLLSVAIVLFTAIPIGISLSLLLSYQGYLVMNNLTTIEYSNWQRELAAAKYRDKFRVGDEVLPADRGAPTRDEIALMLTRYNVSTRHNISDVLFPRQAGGLAFAERRRTELDV